MSATNEMPTADPSVIVGAACRVPGATSTHALWDMLEQRRDLRRKMPVNRYNADSFFHPVGANKSTSNATLGYYLDQGLDEFDAPFFNISGKEAEAMDPQQRLLLEVVYEALEDAGITLDQIRGSNTGVYAGSFTYDYASITHRDLSHYPKYAITGNTNTILPNRVSFCFDLHGPSVQMDTACSSSLTCFHLGNQSLQTGESDMVIICGTALHFDPTFFITMTDFGMLSTDGRCRHFDANASGYVRGDGICAVILKRQRAAEMNGDTIRAIVRGTGANHDGTKEGLTLPNPAAQAELVRSTYAAAGLSTRETGYFEAHGTGTKAGDPREAAGIGAIFAPERNEHLYVGSIKTSIGHLEGASGLAGVIKSMMSVEKGKILPNMHFNTPNPDIDFEKLKIKVPQEVVDWNPENGIRRASINSFGFGGSNAHIILENYSKTLLPLSSASSDTGSSWAITPNSSETSTVQSRPFLLPLSSHSEKGGKLLQERLVTYVKDSAKVDIRDLVYSYSTRRTLHQFRAYAIGRTLEEVASETSTLKPEAKWRRSTTSPRLGFVFTGQGAQWHAMGRNLIEESTLFRQVLTDCEAILQTLPDSPKWSLLDELNKSEVDSRVSQSEFSQPLCAAIQIALVDLLRVWGIHPTAVVGHSSGEIAAAYAAGILSRRDAMICAFYRGLYMSQGKDGPAGRMMAVGLTEAEASIELEPYAGRAVIAAINSPSSITLSGDADAILEIKTQLDARKVFARLLQVEQAFHSHHMLPLAAGFEQAISRTKGFSPRPASARMFSSVSARDSAARSMDSTYWSANMTGRVRFSDALIGMVLDDNEEPAVDVLVEIGPHPALKGPAKQSIKSVGLDLPYVASLDRKLGAYESLLACSGQLFAHGYEVDLAAVNSDHALTSTNEVECTHRGTRLDSLPTYPWDHKKYWAETRFSREYRQRPHRHSLLGAPVPGSPSSNPRWHNYLRNGELTWMPAHKIDGKTILPGAAYFAMAVEAIAQTVPVESIQQIALSDVSIKAALAIPDSDTGAETMLDLALLEDATTNSNVSYSFTIYSFTESGETTQNCKGTVSAMNSGILEHNSESTFAELQARTLHCRSSAKFYERLHKVGLQYGNEFQLVTGDVESAQGFAVAPMMYDSNKIMASDADACIVHPTFLDSAFHVLFAALETKLGRPLDDAYVPTFCHSLRISACMIANKHDKKAQNYWLTAETEVVTPRLNTSDVIVHENDSKLRLVEIEGLELTALGLSAGNGTNRPVFFRMNWKEAFNCLGLSDVDSGHPRINNLEDLLACYNHQFPGNNILYYPSSDTVDQGHQFHLVIVEKDCTEHVANFVQPNGFLISTVPNFSPHGLQPVFSNGKLSIWRASNKELAAWPERLTILLGSSPTARTMNLALAIQELSPGKVSMTTLDKTGEDLFASSDFVSLIGLDEDIFTNSGSKELTHLMALRKLLCLPHKKLIWLQKNTSERSHAQLRSESSLITGLARAARSENESLRLVTFEIGAEYNVQQASSWISSLLDPSLEDDEFVLKEGRLTIPRVEIDEDLNHRLSGGNNEQIELHRFSRDKRLRLMSVPSHAISYGSVAFEEDTAVETAILGLDEVEIAIESSSLTRGDLITSCVGTIIDIGSSSKNRTLHKGDRVLALCSNRSAHTTVLRTRTSMVHLVEESCLLTAASSAIPLLKAYYAIHELAKVQNGDICLVHDAMSMTGRLAIQIVQAAGANLLASVRTSADQDYLVNKFGLPFSSILVANDDDVASSVAEATAGRRCDFVFNSGPSTTSNAMLACLNTSGLLIEFLDQTPATSEPVQLRNNIKYAKVDIASVLNDNIDYTTKTLNKSFKLLQDGTIKSLDHVLSFPYSHLPEAFHAMHTDLKLEQVLLYSNEEAVPVSGAVRGLTTLFKAHKTYLIVGGLGGLGRILTQWMFRKGARKFSFLARSGVSNANAAATVSWLEKRGAAVNVCQGSVTNEATVRQWVSGIEGSLGGVLQGAVALQSGALSEMTSDAWRKVTNPKVKGTYNLHYATLDRPLDFFVCFSSILAIIGFVSEANYSAANGFMDDFIAWRRQQGLPGSSVNIGVVADAGLVAESKTMKAGMDRIGMDKVSEDELFFQFEQAILSQLPDQRGANGVADHQILSGINVSTTDVFWSSKPLFRKLYAGVSANGIAMADGKDKDLASLLRAAENLEAMKETLTQAFIDKISSALSIPSADIHTGLPLSAYGMDSLVAVDFRKWFSKEAGADLALFDILGSKTTGLLIENVCNIIASDATAAPESTQPSNEKAEKQATTSTGTTSDVVSLKTRPAHIPLSSYQTRLWFMDNVMEEDGGLSIGMTLSIKGQPQLERLNQAFHEIARRNEMLRTRYFEGDEIAEQEVLSRLSTNVEYLDVSNDPSLSDVVQRELEKLEKLPMSLEKGEVFRSMLLDLGNAEYSWIFSVHHIAIDGGSRESFMEQIVSCYNDSITGIDSSSSSSPRHSYIDFTLWHENILKSPQVQSDLTWWKQHLTGAPPVCSLLPFAQCDRPEKASTSRRKVHSQIRKSTLKRMKRICGGIDVTPFHFILTALRAFVFRYTSEEDLTILVINGERPHPSFEGIIGFFVNVIPLRWRGAFEETFERLLLQAKGLSMEAMAHSQAPFDSIVEDLEMGWNPQHFPLGQIALNYQMYAKSPKYNTADFEITDVEVDDVPTACEIQFEVMENPETGLDFTMDYDSHLYGASDMDRFLENFMTFIESAVHDFRQPVEEMDMCGHQEIDFLQKKCWLEEKSHLSWMDIPMWERFVEVVESQPKSIAVKTSTGQSITYQSLKRKAEEIASFLQSSGIKAGDRVGVLSQPSIDAIAAMLSTAILRSTYVPLDPNYAQGRVEYMIEDTAPSLILFGSDVEDLVAKLKRSTTPEFFPISSRTAVASAMASHGTGRSDDIFYIVYTSGSTGKPKGIVVSHDNTRAMICGRNQALDLSKHDTFLSQSSISFDISITQTWGSFMSGATVALASIETKQNIEELATFIRDAEVTMTFFTPTQFAMMIEHCPDELRSCKSLRAASMIGEHLHPRLTKAVYDLGIPVTVYNEYGPSETTSQNTLYQVPYPSENQRTTDVGRPLPNNSAYIVNSRLKPVPASVSGELCLGGPQVSTGYLGLTTTTNSVFLPNPFVSGIFKESGWSRLYRTGDLARFRPNGLIDLEGRISGDKQIKLRGNRIDLEEIESEIHRVSSENDTLPFKQPVVVIARALQDASADSLTDDRQLVAFIATKTKHSKEEHQRMANTLHVELSKTLNGYMLPAYYQITEKIDTTLSGKVDRVKLRNMELDPVFHLDQQASTEVDEQPAVVVTSDTGTLQVVKDVFTTVLKLPTGQKIDNNDNFFSLGGQSVLALRLQKTLKEKLKTPVRLIDVFKNPTPAGLNTILAPKATKAVTTSSAAPAGGAVDLDWNKETQLPNEDRYQPKKSTSSIQLTNGQTSSGALLIGADGFVGYYVLKYLLTVNPHTKVYLLSLGDRFNLGDLFAAFMLHKLFDDTLTQADLLSRTEIIQGTMGQDNFGLSAEAFEQLGHNVQSIFHTGGFVSLLATYTDLYHRNVKSMYTMIELASHGRGPVPTSLHYISTWSVIHLQTWEKTTPWKNNKHTFFTDEQSAASFAPPATNDLGYFKTRWVAEMLMEEAAKRGFPTTIYRCPAHTAPIGSDTATPPDNFTINLYVSMVQKGIILKTAERPDKRESDVGMVPIDYLADTLVRLANTDEARSVRSEALRLHVINPKSLPYSKVSAIVGQTRPDGKRGELLDTDKWFEAITALSNENAYLEWATYKEYLDRGHLMFSLQDEQTRPLLEKIDKEGGERRVKCPPVNKEYLGSIVRQEEMFNQSKR